MKDVVLPAIGAIVLGVAFYKPLQWACRRWKERFVIAWIVMVFVAIGVLRFTGWTLPPFVSYVLLFTLLTGLTHVVMERRYARQDSRRGKP